MEQSGEAIFRRDQALLCNIVCNNIPFVNLSNLKHDGLNMHFMREFLKLCFRNYGSKRARAASLLFSAVQNVVQSVLLDETEHSMNVEDQVDVEEVRNQMMTDFEVEGKALH